ncbi:STAS-like domain-containing protein [Burkholderia sp. 3C]
MFAQIDPQTVRWLSGLFSHETAVALVPALEAERNISRQAAAAQVRRWVEAGFLKELGNTRPKRYSIETLFFHEWTFPLADFDEHVAWTTSVRPALEAYASEAALRIWDYAATEMMNNAKDHSDGSSLHVVIWITATDAALSITDNGEGIFRRIARLCELDDERFALLELAKGKLTTDPSRHSGEGIFFTSRAMDRFQIQSGDLTFDHEDQLLDILLDNEDQMLAGTHVVMALCHQTERKLRAVFDEFSSEDRNEGLSRFDKTVIPVRLARLGTESVVSRSQAQRLLARVERFHRVIFDFEGVDSIGQGFADEIFRVFKNQHPDVIFSIVNTNDDVNFMINRVRVHND